MDGKTQNLYCKLNTDVTGIQSELCIIGRQMKKLATLPSTENPEQIKRGW